MNSSNSDGTRDQDLKPDKAAVDSSTFDLPRVMLISFSHFVHDAYTSFLSPLMPLIIERLSLTLGQAGLLSTIMQIPALANPFIGLFADNKGFARWMVILAPTLTALPMCFLGIVPSYGLLLVLVFLAGISVAAFHVPAPVLVSKYAGVKKGRGMSLFMTGGESARTVGPIIAVAAVSILGLDKFHWVLVFAVLTSVILWMYLEKEEPDIAKRKGSLKEAYFEIRHVFIPICGILTFRSFMHASMGMFLTVFVEKETGNLWYGGAALALYEAFGVAGVLSAGTLSDWMGRRKVLFWAIAVAPVALCLFVITSGPVRIIMLLLTGFSVLSTTPVMLAMIQENAKNNPSAANGLFMMSSFALRSFAVVLVGIIGDMGGMDVMFLFSAGMGILGIPFILKLHR